ncbi:ACT domain-containing protein [Streptomyces sp. R39]|uniref:ACT domain-containing protein n=1 Tax=Streptomyces sp. R39 TaxID=3238631 RepID=A0AB39QIC3_9ACTN
MTPLPEAAITVSAVRPLDTLLRVAEEARLRRHVRVLTMSLQAMPTTGGSEIELHVQGGHRDVELLCARLRRLVDVRTVMAVPR